MPLVNQIDAGALPRLFPRSAVLSCEKKPSKGHDSHDVDTIVSQSIRILSLSSKLDQLKPFVPSMISDFSINNIFVEPPTKSLP